MYEILENHQIIRIDRKWGNLVGFAVLQSLASSLKHSLISDVVAFKAVLGNGSTSFVNMDKLNEASALVSRLIARRAHSFRLQHLFRFLRKTHIALCRFKELNITETIGNVNSSTSLYQLDGEVILPTAANVEFLLVRLQSAAKILLRIVSCARESFTGCMEMLNMGFFVETMTTFLTALSTVWSICVEMGKGCVCYYNELMQYRVFFVEKKRSWLPKDCELPKRLEKWLGEEWTREFEFDLPVEDQSTKCDIAFDMDDFDNTDSGSISLPRVPAIEIETLREPQRKMNPQPGPKKPKLSMKAVVREVKMETLLHQNRTEEQRNLDLGEVIRRDNFKPVKAVPMLNINKISTVKEIQKFMRDEQDHRENGQQATSQRLSGDEWRRLQSKIDHLIITLPDKPCVKKFKNLWHFTVTKRGK